MHIGLSTGLTSRLSTSGGGTPAAPDVLNLLGSRDGVAIDFVNGVMKINDSANPGNAFLGNPETKLSNLGSDSFTYDPQHGVIIDAARDFSIALDTSLFPFSTTACTVYVRYRLNNLTNGNTRFLFMTDSSGPDRFATYALDNQAFRFASGDGTDHTIDLSSTSKVLGTDLTAVFGCDANGRTFFDNGGVQADGPETLATSMQGAIGIGGYNDRVLRVLDGTIAQIMILTEPVAKANRLTLTPWPPAGANPPADPPVYSVLGDRDGFAIDFVQKKMRINDRATPANSFDGDPETKLHVHGADPYLYDPSKGLVIDAARDFSIALDTTAFPHNPQATTVYAKFQLNSADSSEQRYVYLGENTGTGRFTLYSTPGASFRFVTGDGTTTDISVSGAALQSDTEYQMVIGADGNGKTFVDHGGIEEDGLASLQSAPQNYVGIGGYEDRVLRVLDGHLAEIAVICEPLPKVTRLTLPPLGKVYRAEGDSHTFNTSLGVLADEFYPKLVADALGTNTSFVNLGGSGDSSAEMVHQLPAMTVGARPDIATIYAGANDGAILVTSDTTATTTTFSVDAVRAQRCEVGGYIIVEGEEVQVTARNNADITVAPALSTPPQPGDTVTIATTTNLEAWIDAMRAEGCQKILVVGYHFINHASGGDTVAQESASRAVIRAKQAAAAASRGVPYCDTFAHMRDRIIAGDVTEGDDLAWHVAVSDTHLNATGEAAVAAAVISRMTELGWL